MTREQGRAAVFRGTDEQAPWTVLPYWGDMDEWWLWATFHATWQDALEYANLIVARRCESPAEPPC